MINGEDNGGGTMINKKREEESKNKTEMDAMK